MRLCNNSSELFSRFIFLFEQVAFSLTQATKITTCGPGHVTFWNLCGSSSDGFRLRAREGCFLMTDTADVESVVEPTNNNKVISTCHWGNILIWEDGRIQLEITRKDGTTCHDGPINQVIAEEG